MSVSYKVIGNHIRAARKRSGLTQEQLAERVELSALHIGRIERGECPLSLSRIAKIADILHVRASELLVGCFSDNSLEDIPSNTDLQDIHQLIESSSKETQRVMLSICWLISSTFQ